MSSLNRSLENAYRLFCIRAAFVATAMLCAAIVTPAWADSPLLVIPGEYVVEFSQKPKTGMSLSADLGMLDSNGKAQVLALGGNSALLRLSPRTSSLVSGNESDGEIRGTAYDADLDQCIELLKRGDVEACSPNYLLSVNDTTPNDPQFPSLWGLNAAKGSNAPRAWNVTTGSSDIVVAVIDTGVDYTHPDLADNMWVNNAEIPGNNIDDDGNGYIDDIHGISAIGRTGNPLDDNGHGSHCAGTIGGKGNNGVGVAGVNWNVKIMALKFLTASGSGSLSAAIDAINYMVDMKNRGVNIRVSSNSWGGGGFSQSLANAIKRATDAGIVFVAAAGNESNNNDQNASYPGGYDSVVSVAAIDQNRNLASFSNYGSDSVDIAAPGVGIYSTYKNGGYATLSGTSMATPHVAGAFALLFAAQPSLASADAINRLYDSGLSLSSLEGSVRTRRMLDIGRFIHNDTAPIPAPTPTPTPCSYSYATTSYSNDTALENAAIILQGDEFNFKQIDLPFSFPFAGALSSSLTVSPNGVVYVDRTPQTMDYQNSSVAPVSSIAAFHADLVMDGELGVRAIVEANRVSIYWLAEHYFMRGKGRIGVRLVINQDGSIEDYISFSTSEIESYMRARATIAVSGPSSSFNATYAYNDNKISNGRAIRFTPLCQEGGSGDLKVLNIKVRDSQTGKSAITPGKKYQMVFNSSGDGDEVATTLVIALDGKTCQETATVMINSGRTVRVRRASRRLNSFRSLTLSTPTGDTRSRTKIRAIKSPTSKKRKMSRRAKASNFSNTCAALAGSL